MKHSAWQVGKQITFFQRILGLYFKVNSNSINFLAVHFFTNQHPVDLAVMSSRPNGSPPPYEEENG